MTYTETNTTATASQEAHLQTLWALRQSIEAQAQGALIACGRAQGRILAKALRKQVRALDYAIDELDQDGAARSQAA